MDEDDFVAGSVHPREVAENRGSGMHNDVSFVCNFILLPSVQGIYAVVNRHRAAFHRHAEVTGYRNRQIAAAEMNRNRFLIRTISAQYRRRCRRARSRTAGVSFAGSAFPDAHLQFVFSEDADEFDVHPFRKLRVVFDFRSDSGEVKKAVEECFGVQVEKVTTMNVRGKYRRQGLHGGYTPSWKKAIVKLTEDSKTIEFFEGMF